MTIESVYEKLFQLYTKLRKANEEFLINNPGFEGFEKLIDLRSVYLDEINLLRDDLIEALSKEKTDLDYDNMELIELINELPNHFPNLTNYKKEVKEALQKLLLSENNVNDSMTELRDDLKQEINQARVGQKTLNAYKPTSGYAGSHFLDRKK